MQVGATQVVATHNVSGIHFTHCDNQLTSISRLNLNTLLNIINRLGGKWTTSLEVCIKEVPHNTAVRLSTCHAPALFRMTHQTNWLLPRTYNLAVYN